MGYGPRSGLGRGTSGFSHWRKMTKTVASVSSKTLQAKLHIEILFAWFWEGKKGKNSAAPVLYKRCKICNSGQGSAFDRGRRGKKLIDFCLKFQSSSLRIACYAGVYLYFVSFLWKRFGPQMDIFFKVYKIKSVLSVHTQMAFKFFCFPC